MYKQQTVQALFTEKLSRLFRNVINDYEVIREIRIRRNGPVCILKGKLNLYLNQSGEYTENPVGALYIKDQEFDELFSHICRHSVYAFEEEMKTGYLTVEGGHRIGIVGHTVWDGATIKALTHYNAINIRIAHEIKGVADSVLPFLFSEGEINSTLIISMPGCGKTTLLRDLIRKISNGNKYCPGKNVSVIDERSEIASSYMGIAQNDVGIHTDVLDACPKAQGMLWVLRSMAPEVIAVDELGGESDYKAVQQAFYLGCRVIATLHGSNYESILSNQMLQQLISSNGFRRIIFMGKRDNPGCITQIYDENGKELLV